MVIDAEEEFLFSTSFDSNGPIDLESNVRNGCIRFFWQIFQIWSSQVVFYTIVLIMQISVPE